MQRDWKAIRQQQFRRRHGRALATRLACARCGGPVSETMGACPFCGRARPVLREPTREPGTCPRCKRGVKLDWRFCPWCWGAAIGPRAERRYSDRRYVARCHNGRCPRRDLMPWMRYCPWCHAKVRRPWRDGLPDACPRCRWGVTTAFWEHCPWCRARLGARR